MIVRKIRIGSWIVRLFFRNGYLDMDAVIGALEDIDASERVIRRAVEILASDGFNNGFTYSSAKKKVSIVYVGRTTSGKQFLNTLAHEIHHVAVAIAASLGVDLEGETPAYISGDAIMALAEDICQLGCRE